MHLNQHIKQVSLNNDKVRQTARMVKRNTGMIHKVQIRPNKKNNVFLVTGLKILGRVGTRDFFLIIFFSCHSKCMKLDFFHQKPLKNSRFHQ